MLRLLKGGRSGADSRTPPRVGRADDALAPLAQAACAGDARAQRTLLVTLGPSLLRVVRGVLGSSHPDAEDTLQEAMVAVHLALPGFRGECTTLHFACRVAVQTALNARRRSGYRSRHTPSTEPAELIELARDDRSPGDAIDAAKRLHALRELLCELPEAQAEVLALHTLLGYTVEETAHTLGAPPNTVRSRLRAALARLRERVQSERVLLELIEGDS